MRLMTNDELFAVSGGEDLPPQCEKNADGDTIFYAESFLGTFDDMWLIDGDTCIRIVNQEVVFWDDNPN